MTTKQTLISFLTITFLSLLGTGLWLYEIVQIQTWHSLAWLYNQLYSPFIVTLLTVTSFLTAFIVTKTFTSIKKLIIALTLLYLVSGICYWTGKTLCYFIYHFWAPLGYILVTTAFFAVAILGTLGFLYWLILQELIRTSKKANILLISFLAFLSLPLSLLTIQLFEGFGSGNHWEDAVKMGYPIFWITMLLGGAGIIIARQPKLAPK